jgi:hypothetical protein
MSPPNPGHPRSKNTTIPRPATNVKARSGVPANSRNVVGRVPSPRSWFPKYGIPAWQVVLGLTVAMASFILYFQTAFRSMPPGDSGELITAAWNWGVAHPPGYPLFTLLSRLFGFLPFGSPAFRLNILSVLLDALAAGLLALGIARLIFARQSEHSGKSAWLLPSLGALAGSGLLVVSTAFWLYSTAAEVFALNNFLAVLTLVLMLEWVNHPASRWTLCLSGLLAGLALTNQFTFILLAPGFIALIVFGLMKWRRETRQKSGITAADPGWRVRDLAITTGLIFVGLMPYLYLPFAASRDPVLNFGDPSHFSSFWRVVTRADYGTLSFTVDNVPGSRWGQWFYIFRYFWQSFTWLGISLIAAGAVWLALKERLIGLSLALFFLFSGPIFAMFANPNLANLLTLGVFERFYILPGIFLAVIAGCGAYFIVEILKQPVLRVKNKLLLVVPALGLALTLALLVVQGAARYPELNMSRNNIAQDYGADLLGPLEPNSLLIMRSDYNYESVVYQQEVLGFRIDVIALHAELLKGSWYIQQQKSLHPDIIIPFSAYDEGRTNSLIDLVKANLGQRPVYGSGAFKEELTTQFDRVNWGLTYRLLPKGQGSDPFALMRLNYAKFTALHYPAQKYPDISWENQMARQYAVMAADIAFDLQQPGAQKDAAIVEDLYRKAILIAPDISGSYKNLGLVLYLNDGQPAEIIKLWEKYFTMTPEDPQNPDMREIIAQLKSGLRR